MQYFPVPSCLPWVLSAPLSQGAGKLQVRQNKAEDPSKVQGLLQTLGKSLTTEAAKTVLINCMLCLIWHSCVKGMCPALIKWCRHLCIWEVEYICLIFLVNSCFFPQCFIRSIWCYFTELSDFSFVWVLRGFFFFVCLSSEEGYISACYWLAQQWKMAAERCISTIIRCSIPSPKLEGVSASNAASWGNIWVSNISAMEEEPLGIPEYLWVHDIFKWLVVRTGSMNLIVETNFQLKCYLQPGSDHPTVAGFQLAGCCSAVSLSFMFVEDSAFVLFL